MKKKILLLVNSKSRSGEGTCEFLFSALHESGHEVLSLYAEDKAADFNYLILKYHQEVDLVIIGGGDGSINFVLPSLVITKLPLLVYPLGTANLLARSFDITADIKELLSLVEVGEVISIDLGSVNDLYFINVCGLGISTEVNSRVSKTLKRLTGPLSFWLTGLRLSPNLKPFKISISVDGGAPFLTRTWQVTVCNGRHYAAWMTIKKEATYGDQKLHCLSTEVTKWWHGIRLLPSYFKGEYDRDQEITLLSGREISIHSKRAMPIDVDGDIKTSTPAVFKVHPGALNLIVPPACTRQDLIA